MTNDPSGSDPFARPENPMPYAPPVGADQYATNFDPTAPRPKSVDNSFMLWIVNAAISLIGGVIGLFVSSQSVRDAVRKSLEKTSSTVTEADIDTAVNVARTVGVVIGVLFLALYLLFAFKMRAGRNWARIVLLILGVLNILGTVFALANGTTPGVGIAINVVQAVIVIAAVVLMYRPDASQYFASGRPR
jgi:hypothetical protein